MIKMRNKKVQKRCDGVFELFLQESEEFQNRKVKNRSFAIADLFSSKGLRSLFKD